MAYSRVFGNGTILEGAWRRELCRPRHVRGNVKWRSILRCSVMIPGTVCTSLTRGLDVAQSWFWAFWIMILWSITYTFQDTNNRANSTEISCALAMKLPASVSLYLLFPWVWSPSPQRPATTCYETHLNYSTKQIAPRRDLGYPNYRVSQKGRKNKSTQFQHAIVSGNQSNTESRSCSMHRNQEVASKTCLWVSPNKTFTTGDPKSGHGLSSLLFRRH